MGALEPVLGSLAPRVHMLLLCLSLLLWTGSCSEMHGKNTPGTYFDVAENRLKDITGIEFYSSIIGIIKGFKVRFGSTWSNVYCKRGPITQRVMLDPGEHVVTVQGDFRLYILRMIFITNRGQKISVGYRTGYEFKSRPDRSGKVLTGLCGKCFVLGLSNVCFKWDFPVQRAPPPTPKPREYRRWSHPPDSTEPQETNNEGTP